jgi:hypothetical protein
MLLPGGGLNSTISFFTGNSPFNAIEEFAIGSAGRRRGEVRLTVRQPRDSRSGVIQALRRKRRRKVRC